MYSASSSAYRLHGGSDLVFVTESTFRPPHSRYQPTMESVAFKDNEEATYKLERTSLRAYISACHGEVLGNTSLDLDTIKEKYTRLCEIQRLFVAHTMTLQNGDALKESESHTKYAQMMQNITDILAPKVARTKPAEVKLPKVDLNDPGSWFSFKSMLEAASRHRSVSDEEKYMQLVAALPTKVAVQVRDKPFKDAMAIATKYFESPKTMVDVVRSKFRALPPIQGPFDLDNLKRLQEEIEFAMSLSSEAKVTDKAFKKALQALPRPMKIAFIDVGKDLSLGSLNEYVKKRIDGIELLEVVDGCKWESKGTTPPKDKRIQGGKKKSFDKPATSKEIGRASCRERV